MAGRSEGSVKNRFPLLAHTGEPRQENRIITARGTKWPLWWSSPSSHFFHFNLAATPLTLLTSYSRTTIDRHFLIWRTITFFSSLTHPTKSVCASAKAIAVQPPGSYCTQIWSFFRPTNGQNDRAIEKRSVQYRSMTAHWSAARYSKLEFTWERIGWEKLGKEHKHSETVLTPSPTFLVIGGCSTLQGFIRLRTKRDRSGWVCVWSFSLSCSFNWHLRPKV